MNRFKTTSHQSTSQDLNSTCHTQIKPPYPSTLTSMGHVA